MRIAWCRHVTGCGEPAGGGIVKLRADQGAAVKVALHTARNRPAIRGVATSDQTVPSGRRVDVCEYRHLDIDPPAANEPTAGSYSVAPARHSPVVDISAPPLIKTVPFMSKDAACKLRQFRLAPLWVNVPAEGS